MIVMAKKKTATKKTESKKIGELERRLDKLSELLESAINLQMDFENRMINGLGGVRKRLDAARSAKPKKGKK